MLRALLLLINMVGVPRLVVSLMRDRRVPLLSKLVIPAAIAYVILPIDLVPDIIPALGQIDDILAIALSLAVFLAIAPRDVVSEHIHGARRGSAKKHVKDNARGAKPTVIEGRYHVKDDDSEPQA